MLNSLLRPVLSPVMRGVMEVSGVRRWSPALIAPKLKAWYDPSDIASMWQESTAVTPAAVGQPVGKILDKSGLGNHAVQATAANRPILRQDGNGNYYLEFDGSNDFLRCTFAISQPWGRASAIRKINAEDPKRVLAASGPYYTGELLAFTPIYVEKSGVALDSGGFVVPGCNYVITEKHAGASSRIEINRNGYATGDSGANVTDGITIGGASSALGAGYCSNIHFYGTVMAEGLTDDDATNLKTYLARKSNVSGATVFSVANDYYTFSGLRRYSYQSSYVDSATDAGFANALEVLLPDTYNPSNSYPLIVVLGVEPTPYQFADEIQVIKTAGLHNTHNAIFCKVNTKTYPWWGAKADGTVDYEKLVRDGIVPWMRTKFSIVAGRQGVSLLGYSKGGWGAYSLILRNPTAFGYAAAWDAPLTSSYAAMASNQADVAIGSSAQWALYSPSAILAENVASVNDKNRLVLTGYNLFNTEVTAFASLLTSNSVAYTYDSTSRASHNANSGWMAGTVGSLAALW